MAYHFVECNREQKYLMPPSLEEWLPKGDLAWFVLDAVEQMDVESIRGKYRQDGCGSEAYDPEMMVPLLLYAYCMGERSSRKIESLCEKDIAFRVIAANQKPDHSTINRFRGKNAKELAGLFVQILRLCAEAGLVKVGVVALDGTKVKANAALSANRSYEHLEEEVKKMLEEAEAKDKEEDEKYGVDKRGDEIPEELKDRKSRLARLDECWKRLQREAKDRAAEQEEKIRERKEAEERGEKRRGRKPKEPDEESAKEAKANVTDPESRIMKTRKGYEQGYNAQAVVTTDQVIVAAQVTQEANDVKQLRPMLEETRKRLIEAGIQDNVEVALADAGYCSDENLKGEREGGPELLIATKKDWKQRKELGEESSCLTEVTEGMTRREKMTAKLRTDRGKALYRLRSQTVEPVFGQIKEIRGCDRFMRRGLIPAQDEWMLICGSHNLLKLWRSRACPDPSGRQAGGKAQWN